MIRALVCGAAAAVWTAQALAQDAAKAQSIAAQVRAAAQIVARQSLEAPSLALRGAGEAITRQVHEAHAPVQ